MKHFIFLSLILFTFRSFGAVSQAALRLESLKSTINARDFDLATYRIRQFEILDRACEHEMITNKVPFACYEFRNQQRETNYSLRALDDQCLRAVEQKSDKREFDDRQLKQMLQYVSSKCRSKIVEQKNIEAYKRFGQRFE